MTARDGRSDCDLDVIACGHFCGRTVPRLREQRSDGVRFGQVVDLLAQTRSAGDAADVPAQMLAHLEYAGLFTVALDHGVEVRAGEIYALRDGRGRRRRKSGHRGRDRADEP